MTPPESIKLSIYRGPIKDFDGEGLYDIQVFANDNGAVVSIRDILTDEIIFDGLPIEYITMSAPFVRIKVA